MTFRNGIKEYILSALIFGAPMGLLFGVLYLSWIIGVIGGVLAGALFSLLISIFVKIQEKKFAKMREELTKTQHIICDGGATVDGNGGWLFLSDESLSFHAHKLNFNTQNVVIPLETISSVDKKRNQIIVNTVSGSQANIIVSHVSEWKAEIEKQLGTRIEN